MKSLRDIVEVIEMDLGRFCKGSPEVTDLEKLGLVIPV